MLCGSYGHPSFHGKLFGWRRRRWRRWRRSPLRSKHVFRRVCCMARTRSLRCSLILPAQCSETSLLVCSDARWACLLRRRAGGQSTPRSERRPSHRRRRPGCVGGRDLPRREHSSSLPYIDTSLESCSSLRHRRILMAAANLRWIRIF